MASFSLASRRSPVQDHGGNRREALEANGLDRLLDFSASINPLGHPEGLREHLNSRWEEVLHYPERGAPALADFISETLGAPRAGILVGNGSAEPIDLALRTLGASRLVLCPPDFGLYQELAPRGTPVVKVPRREACGFAVDGDGLARAIAPGDLVVLSNPGNPCGAAASREEILRVLGRCRAVGATLAVDEAFVDFCPDRSVLPEAGRDPSLVVFRSLTKFFGIPGIRLGFLVGPPGAVARMSALQVPWSVNALAQAAGIFCLARPDWPARTLACVAESRRLLADGLARVPGLYPLPSEANYLLVETRPPAPDASSLYEGLARQGILIRHCGSFGLGQRYFRVAVRTREENEVLLSALSSPALVPNSRRAE
jgi:threonine-phosphate decarboxylase